MDREAYNFLEQVDLGKLKGIYKPFMYDALQSEINQGSLPFRDTGKSGLQTKYTFIEEEPSHSYQINIMDMKPESGKKKKNDN